MNARAASSAVPECGLDAKSYMTSGDPPKSFQRTVMFAAVDVRRFVSAESCSLVATRTDGKFLAAFRSKSGAGCWYMRAAASLMTDAFVRPPNCHIAPTITAQMAPTTIALIAAALFVRFAL